MEIIANLPIEMQWNIIKYMRHPVAEAFKKQVFSRSSAKRYEQQRSK